MCTAFGSPCPFCQGKRCEHFLGWTLDGSTYYTASCPDEEIPIPDGAKIVIGSRIDAVYCATPPTREEHLAWCKKRALAYLPGNPTDAFTSMSSDLGKHEETKGHIGIELGMNLFMSGFMKHPDEVRRFIEGFN